ncbi:MAG: hypothetical protein RL011_1060, partial [Pseudomonadota bacterium]
IILAYYLMIGVIVNLIIFIKNIEIDLLIKNY